MGKGMSSSSIDPFGSLPSRAQPFQLVPHRPPPVFHVRESLSSYSHLPFLLLQSCRPSFSLILLHDSREPTTEVVQRRNFESPSQVGRSDLFLDLRGNESRDVGGESVEVSHLENGKLSLSWLLGEEEAEKKERRARFPFPFPSSSSNGQHLDRTDWAPALTLLHIFAPRCPQTLQQPACCSTISRPLLRPASSLLRRTPFLPIWTPAELYSNPGRSLDSLQLSWT